MTNAPREGKAPVNYTPENIEGKAAVVTGGTTGIGLATARLLVERGARVLIFGRKEEELQDALEHIQAGGGEAHGLVADQSKGEDIQRVFQAADERLGGVDILVNNAALAAESVQNTDYDDIAYVVNTNLVGYMACCHEAIARMKPKRMGHIVNVGSMSADAREENSDIYVATKAAVQGFSESLRKTINKEGIKVSLIEPGLIATPILKKSEEELRESVAKEEMLKAEDIAECVHYILTQPARCDVVVVQIRPHLQPI